jgi:hypothetical protein
MTITAKYASRCLSCKNLIAVGESINWQRGLGVRHATFKQCAAATEKARIAAVADSALASALAPPAKLDLLPLMEFITDAKDAGLKSPKLRVLAPDGKTELRLSLTKSGQLPGSLAIVANFSDERRFLGGIRPDGTSYGALATDTVLQAHLVVVAADPAAAAKAYAVLMCRCSFCGLPLTDEGSVEVGYGKVCAAHWNLPHAQLGTIAPKAVQA